MLFKKKFEIRKIAETSFIVVNVKVWNPWNPKRFMARKFLVDTGASGCAISQQLADQLELQPVHKVEVVLADETKTVTVPAGFVYLQIDGKTVYAYTIWGEGFPEILGLDVMTGLGIHVDVPAKNVMMPAGIKMFKIKNIRLNNNFNPVLIELFGDLNER